MRYSLNYCNILYIIYSGLQQKCYTLVLIDYIGTTSRPGTRKHEKGDQPSGGETTWSNNL